MEVIESIEEMRCICKKLRHQTSRIISFVPTMGALHAGHCSLIQMAREVNPQTLKSYCPGDYHSKSDDSTKTVCVIVSIFVNPRQFENPIDLEQYPNTFEADLKICRQLGVEYVFAPKACNIYPDSCKGVTVKPPEGIGDHLEGKSRAGFFEGVLTVVCKLFNIIQPDKAYFGEKDYQQLLLVSQMVKDLNMGIEICPGPTARDYDNLALSSRNVRLNLSERKLAPIIYKILSNLKTQLESTPTAKCLESNANLEESILKKARSLLESSGVSLDTFRIDYIELRCAKDFSKITIQKSPDHSNTSLFNCERNCLVSASPEAIDARLLIAVILGTTRLLDNVGLSLNADL